MRRVGAAILLLAVAVLSAANAAAGADAWKRYVHPSPGFSLRYPPEWELASRQGIIGLALIGPEIAGTDDMRLTVLVGWESLPPDITLDQYEAITESKQALLFNSYQRLRTDRTQIAGKPAVLRYYTWKLNNGVGIYQMQLYMIIGTRGFVLSGTTTTGSPSLAQDAVLLRSIILSFKPKV